MRISDWSSDVCSSDLAYANADGSVEILEAPSGGYPDGYLMEQPVLSRDGSTSAFWSSASNLDPTKVSDEHEVFVHLRSTDTVVRLPLAEGQVAPWRGAQLALSDDGLTIRSEGRRDGKECVSTCRYRLPAHQ